MRCVSSDHHITGTFLFFGCFCIAAAVFSYFYVPETAQKSLEQIALLFNDVDAKELELQARIEREVFSSSTVAAYL